jgi:drug/metabolite transporter (DMT)-like permease
MVGIVDDESDDAQGSIGGDIVALISSAGYGLYTTLIRYFVDDEIKMPMQLTLGYIGLLNVLILIIPITILVSC